MRPPDYPDAVLALALPAPDLDLTVDPGTVVLTPHAVQRYRERVEGVPRRLAARRISILLVTAQWRSRPRTWTKVVLHPDVVYGYSPDRPVFEFSDASLGCLQRWRLDRLRRRVPEVAVDQVPGSPAVQIRLRDPQRLGGVTDRAPGSDEIEGTTTELRRVGLGHDERLLQAAIGPSLSTGEFAERGQHQKWGRLPTATGG